MSEKMYPLKLYVRHTPHAALLALAFLLNAAIWVELLWKIRPTEDQIFLHYTILFGVDLFGEWWRVLYLPLGGLLIIMVNTVIGWMIFQRDKFLVYLLLIVSILCQIFLFIQALLLVFLNV